MGELCVFWERKRKINRDTNIVEWTNAQVYLELRGEEAG